MPSRLMAGICRESTFKIHYCVSLFLVFNYGHAWGMPMSSNGLLSFDMMMLKAILIVRITKTATGFVAKSKTEKNNMSNFNLTVPETLVVSGKRLKMV